MFAGSVCGISIRISVHLPEAETELNYLEEETEFSYSGIYTEMDARLHWIKTVRMDQSK